VRFTRVRHVGGEWFGSVCSCGAARVGISAAYLSKIEAGRSSSVIDHAVRALRILGARVTITFDADITTEEAELAGR
jgi:hypothetical protein